MPQGIGHNDLKKRLAAAPIFSECSGRQLDAVARQVDVREVEAGAVLAEQGAAGDSFFVILDGRAEVRRHGRTVATLEPGSFFGELALLDPAPRDATVVAETPLTVARLSQGPFRRLLGEVPAMNGSLLRALARRLREADFRDF